MILINEFLPNPVGNDATGEWIELYNNGPRSVSLAGWHLQAGVGKPYAARGVIGAGEFKVFTRQETKLTLRNSNETLVLYDAAGAPADTARFSGSAPEGKSLSRFGASFVFADPTPGKENVRTGQFALVEQTAPVGILFGPRFGAADVLALALSCGALCAAAVWYAAKRNLHDLPKPLG